MISIAILCIFMKEASWKTPADWGLAEKAPIQKVGKVASRQTLSDLLGAFSVERTTIARLTQASRRVFDPREMRSGQPWQAFFTKEERKLRYFVYQENIRDAVVFDLADPMRVFRRSRKLKRVERTIFGTIEKNLAASLAKGENPADLALRLDQLFAADIAFNRLQKGDWFTVIYDADLLDDQAVDLAAIKAACIRHKGKTHYRFSVDDKVIDENGRRDKPLFLRTPIHRGLVTSPYTQRRFHPILKRYTPHLGTDFGANRGTPILAMADGVVGEIAQNRYNGKFVKIQHDRVYQTQYLHMSRWAKGLRKGQKVKQGSVIGYVGRTGLADGYHVCLRFWKNGRQVNFQRQRFPKTNKSLEGVAGKEIQTLKNRLDQLAASVRP